MLSKIGRRLDVSPWVATSIHLSRDSGEQHPYHYRSDHETAPLLFTAFGNPFMNINILKPVNSLPLLVFNYAASPYPEWHALAWGASLVLAVLVLTLNFIAKVLTKKWKVQF